MVGENPPADSKTAGRRSSFSAVVVLAGRGKNVPQAFEGGQHGGERKLQQHRPHGAAKDDHGRGWLQNLGQIPAFEQQSGDDAGEGQNDSANAAFIHGTAPL